MRGSPTSRAQLSPRPPLRRLDGTHPRGVAPWCVCMIAAWAPGMRLKSHPKAHSRISLSEAVGGTATSNGPPYGTSRVPSLSATRRASHPSRLFPIHP